MIDVQKYLDSLLKLHIKVENLSKESAIYLIKVLNKREKEILMLLFDYDLSKVVETSAFKKKISDIVKKYEKEEVSLINRSINKVLTLSGGYTVKNLKNIIDDVIIDRNVSINEVMNHVLMDNSETIGDIFKKYMNNSSKRLLTIPRLSYQNGWSVSKTSKKIKELSNIDKRLSNTITRTVLMSANNLQQKKVNKANGIVKEMYMATLDSRTSPRCRFLDGKVFKVDEGPFPPIHYNCRSLRVSIPIDMSNKEFLSEIERSYRDKNGKIQYGKYQTYDKWIKSQPYSYQVEILGKERADLLKKDKISFDKLYTNDGNLKRLNDL